MASWVALNIEPDDGIEEEVDDTKELQIEEALKLYHHALKLHSQGPEFYPQAAEAYETLFNSEIFKYPESLSDFKRAALPDSQAADVNDGDVADAIAEFSSSDSNSSLFQTLYLSYKNHGKYVLDLLQESLRQTPQDLDGSKEATRETREASKKALGSFAEALERDDTDLNLWRQGARLGSALHSYRLNRFCLESVLADDENRLEVRSEQLGLEEILSEDRLRNTLKSLFDVLSASQIPVKKPNKALARYLKQHEDSYPYLPNLPVDLTDLDSSKGPLALSTTRREITPRDASWESVGQAILEALDEEDQAPLAAGPIRSFQIVLPRKDPEPSEPTSIKAEDIRNDHEGNGEEIKADNEDFDMIQESERENTNSDPTKISPEKQSSLDEGAEKQLMESLEGQSAQQPPIHPDTIEGEINSGGMDSNSPTDTRKRSSASAANEEQPDGQRMKSRRTRARESNADVLVQPDEIAFDTEKYYKNRLEVFVNADDWMFSTVDSLFSKIGVRALGSIESVREKVAALGDSSGATPDSETRLFQDLRGLIKDWNDARSRLMQQKDDLSSLKDIRGTSKSGLAVFLEHSRKANRKPLQHDQLPADEHLDNFATVVNDGWLHPHETTFEWLKRLFMPQFGDPTSGLFDMKSAYACFQWSETLKQTITRVLIREDEFIYARLGDFVEELERRVLASDANTSPDYQPRDFGVLDMIEAIYEFHLDIFASVENLSSEASQEKRLAQRDRLTRWGMLARTALHHFINYCPSEDYRRNIALRHMWASTFQVNLAGEAERDHTLLCLQDLKRILQSIGGPVINLVNNSIMSELSAAIIDQELLKLKCMDFFAKVFNPEDEDPVSLIEAIEPILEPSSVEYVDVTPDDKDVAPPSHTSEMASFLDRGDATLRLFLWRRLQEAYQAIDYPPKVVSCYLRSIETIVTELEDAKHTEETPASRQIALLGWLKSLDGILSKTIPLVQQQAEKAFECVDMDHLHASMSAVARLARLLHNFILYEDSVRVGQISGRDLRGSLAKSLENFKEKMRESYVRCWILQYTLFVEAVSQNKDQFDEPLEDRIHILRSVHNALGVRSMCRYSQKRFLKLLKSELFELELKGDYEFDVCQVLFDLHGIKFSPFDGTIDHGCPSEKLDRPTATMMIDFVLRQAQKMNMKDLSKSELKTTIEKMQQAIGPARLLSQSPQMGFNRRLFTAYIKAPINPSSLLRAVQGVSQLSFMTVPGENAKIAAKGWYFLLGHATLTKFRSQKRLSPGSTSDLDDAINFFRQDLDHATERWETWYRLAQAYDTKLEEEITWAADKINNNRSELAMTQRYAIHCYAMAVSTAIRTVEPTTASQALLSDLYTDFGIRMYSSSREPLSMGAFSLSEFSRHFSSEESQQMYKCQPFREMSRYSVWNFASNLLRRALVDKPKRWMTQYFLGKCLWKMYSTDDSMRSTSKRVEMQDVLDALDDAIASLPQRKDSRSDPIFEPHFKLLSVVHKLVQRGDMTPVAASQALLATPWARKADLAADTEGWKPYVLEVIRKFKGADKSNWHHRMSAKAAHVMYDDERNATAAAAAKHELSQIFTKTLTIQVWRPEYERPGRHFVYTTRYVYFFVSLLDQLDDRASLDQLLRRVRKKQGDFINHTSLWEDICLTYAKMIRRAAQINEGHEEGVFRPIGWEEFLTKTARLESLTSFAPESLVLLELIRDSLELKKLNNNLMKVTMFEDLIADLYARLYEVNMPQLLEQASEENKEKMKVDRLLMTGDGTTDPSTPTTSLPASDTPAPRGRTKGIARRDIQKRADAIVNSKLGPRAAAKFAAAVETETSTSNPRASNISTAAASTPAAQESSKQTSTAEDSTGVARSEPNGAHDTGNDSEASDVDGTNLGKNLGDPTKEQGEGETEEDEAGSGNEGAEEGDGEEDDDVGNDHDGETGDGDEDPGVTEGETGVEYAQEGDDDGEDDEMQDVDESTVVPDTQDEGKAASAVAPGEEVGKPEHMDTTPA